MLLAGIVGTSAGGVQPFLAMPGSNWYTLNTVSDANFYDINGVLVINGNGTTSVSTSVSEMAIDDINISAATAANPLPVFTAQPTDKTICSSGTTTFTGTASNTATYFWLISSDGLIWNPINSSNAGTTFSGYNTNTLTVTNPNVALNGLYISVTAVNSTGGNQSSNAVRLYVTSSPNAGTITGGNAVCVGANLSLANSVTGGAWSIVGGRATINISGVVTGVSAGSTTVKYTVGSGACLASSTLALTVNALPATPTIAFASGTRNVAGSGGYCINKTFTLVGTPSGGSWSSTGGVTVNSSGFVITGATTGAFSITYTYANSNGCRGSRTASSTLVACASRGINNTNKLNDDNIIVYPNPSKNFVNINLKNATTGTTATIFNLMGKQVKTQVLSIGNNNINISELPKGIYTISVSNSDGLKTQKIILE
jgi:hypothetical protein